MNSCRSFITDTPNLHQIHLIDDLTGGAKRLMQTATGYMATVRPVSIVQCDGQETGARPGAVVRGGRTDAQHTVNSGVLLKERNDELHGPIRP
jgi:hypothetical protein